MTMTVALRAGDTMSSKIEQCPPAVGKGDNSVFSPVSSPSDDRVVTNQKLHQELNKAHNIGGT